MEGQLETDIGLKGNYLRNFSKELPEGLRCRCGEKTFPSVNGPIR